jgi:alginate O-acetyltransferase complex protein AlgI
MKSVAIFGIVVITIIFLLSKFFLPVLSPEVDSIALGVPIGLSFYSLQAISYIVDSSNDKTQIRPNSMKLILFLSFFPQSMCGPIHRYENLAYEFEKIEFNEMKEVGIGIKLMLWGYFCKLIVADKIDLIVHPILNVPQQENGANLFAATLLYSFQIYFDFYGYTLIATGVARMFGIRFAENFNDPYSTKSFKEFWRRWHMTFSKWLRDYVYKQLGGRRNSAIGFVVSVSVTFLVSAVWHGITVNFFLWGVIHILLYLGSFVSGQ